MNEPDKGTVSAAYHTPSVSPDAPTPASAGDQVTQKRSEPTIVPSDLATPDVPGYSLSRKLGEGGMGAVYLAHDATFERDIAVKVMHAGQSASRFVTESKVTAQLPHPGVPPVYAIGELSDGRPFLAMKLVEGRTLADELRTVDRATALPRLLSVFEQVCQTVGFAHSKGIVHRDLKPSNVMVGAFGETLVMDWGIAKPTGSEQPAGEGTPAYMSPEQTGGEPVDPRADVFALGGILGVVLTGRPAVDGLDECGADAELVALAKRCLAANAADRYANGEEVSAAVSAYRSSVEERLRTAERDGAVHAAEAREQRKRRKVQLALTAAVVLMLASGGAFAWWEDRRAEQANRKQAEFEAQRATDAAVAAERDRAAKAQARRVVTEGLALAPVLRKGYKFDEAGAVLEQAAGAARGGAPDLLEAVEQAQRDLAFVRRLDDIRYRKLLPVKRPDGTTGSDTQYAPPAYRRAFVDRGLDPDGLSPAEFASRLASSAVKAELVAAVDDWALYEPDGGLRERLLDVARRADPHPLTDRLRDPAVRNDPAALMQLAREAVAAPVRPVAASVLSELLLRQRVDPMPLLAAARVRHPDDFELAFVHGDRLRLATPVGEAFSRRAHGLQFGPYEAARALRPDNPYVWANLGLTLALVGEPDRAVEALREAIRLGPTVASTRNLLAGVLNLKRDHDGALVEYRAALLLDPDDASAYAGIGTVLGAKGDDEGAVAALREAIRRRPTEVFYRMSLGNILSGRRRHEEALVEYRAAIRLQPRSTLVYSSLGGALSARGDWDGARAAYAEAIRLDPKNGPAHFGLGNVLKAKNDLDGAIAAYEESVRVYPGSAYNQTVYGDALVLKGNLRGAEAAYREALRIDPKSGIARSGLSNVLRLAGDLRGVVSLWKEGVRIDPNSAFAHLSLGLALSAVKDFSGAAAAYGEATRLEPKKAGTWSLLARARSQGGDLAGAVEAYREATRLNPRSVLDHQLLSGVYFQQQKYEEAISSARAALALDANNAYSHYCLGVALQQIGDISGARAAFTEAARLDPKRWAPLLAQLPPLPLAPPPREK